MGCGNVMKLIRADWAIVVGLLDGCWMVGGGGKTTPLSKILLKHGVTPIFGM